MADADMAGPNYRLLTIFGSVVGAVFAAFSVVWIIEAFVLYRSEDSSSGLCAFRTHCCAARRTQNSVISTAANCRAVHPRVPSRCHTLPKTSGLDSS